MRYLALLVLLASAAFADGSLMSGQPKYQWKTLTTAEVVGVSSTTTLTAKFEAFPNDARVLQVTTSSTTPTEASLSILVLGSVDGTNFESPTESTSLTRVTSDGTYMFSVPAPRKDVVHSKVVLINHSATVTTTAAILMGSH